jgi:hypothetical protein
MTEHRMNPLNAVYLLRLVGKGSLVRIQSSRPISSSALQTVCRISGVSSESCASAVAAAIFRLAIRDADLSSGVPGSGTWVPM